MAHSQRLSQTEKIVLCRWKALNCKMWIPDPDFIIPGDRKESVMKLLGKHPMAMLVGMNHRYPGNFVGARRKPVPSARCLAARLRSHRPPFDLGRCPAAFDAGCTV